MNVAFVQSCWHRDLVDGTRDGFLAELRTLVPDVEIETFEVPGAFEIPLHAKLLARSGRYDAIACAGLVVDGGIYRHEFVAEAVISGLMRVQLDTDVPVFTAVLTPQQFHEHADHQRFFAEHLVGKGQELARACASTVEAIRALPA